MLQSKPLCHRRATPSEKRAVIARFFNITRSAPAPAKQLGAKEVVTRFYDAYNAGDIQTIENLMAEDCSYHDMIYEEPFVGRWVARNMHQDRCSQNPSLRDAVVAYMRKVREIVPAGDLRFVIDDATEGDPRRVGIMW